MAWPTAAMALAAAQGALSPAVEVALFSTVPGEFPGTELTSAGYARQPVVWTVAGDLYTSGALVFDIVSGQTVRGFGLYTAGGVFYGGGPLAERYFLAGGTYRLTVSAGGQ